MSDGRSASGAARSRSPTPTRRCSRPAVTKLDLARHYERVARGDAAARARPPAGAPGVPRRASSVTGFFMKSMPAPLPGLDRNRVTRGQEGRHAHPGPGRERGDARLPRRPERGHAAHLALARGRAAPARPADHRLRPVARGAGSPPCAPPRARPATRLRDAGLVPYAMVTGSRGIHVVCPLRRGPSFGEVHAYARALAEAMVADDPRRLTLEWRRGRPRRADLPRRQPHQLRPARRRALRGPAHAAGAGGDADPLGGAR